MQLKEVCNKANVKSIIEVMEDTDKIFRLMKEVSKVNGRTKKMLINIIEIFIKSFGKSISMRLVNKFYCVKEKMINEIKPETKSVH